MERLLGHLLALMDCTEGGGAAVARYSSLIGTGIEVVYRAWNLDLRTSGKLLRDSGTFIIVEQHLEQERSIRNYQLKLPYNCIIKIERN
jgi:hypothetical protein